MPKTLEVLLAFINAAVLMTNPNNKRPTRVKAIAMNGNELGLYVRVCIWILSIIHGSLLTPTLRSFFDIHICRYSGQPPKNPCLIRPRLYCCSPTHLPT